MSATVAIVVPSLKVLAWITELPTLIGTSRIIPVMVERIWVLLKSLYRLVMPVLTISRLSSAFWNSSSAWRRVVCPFSNSSCDTTPLA